MVDNRPVELDVAPFQRDGATYLPLRFVAESLGGHVRYLPAQSLIAIEDSQAPGSSPARVMRHTQTYAPATPAPGPPSVHYQHPAPGEFVTGGFPAISALIRTHGGTAANIASLRLYLDGQDVTGGAAFAPGAVGYTPTVALVPGTHQVAVRGFDTAGRAFSAVWTFAEVAFPGGAPPGVVGYQNSPLTASGTRISAPGDSLQVALTTNVPGTGYVTICGYNQQYPLFPVGDAFHYVTTVAPPIGYFAPLCQANAFFIDRNNLRTAFTLPAVLYVDTRPRP
jgi:hypothetical protein